MAKEPNPTPQRPETVTTTINLRAIKWIETPCRGSWWPFSGPWGNLPPSPPGAAPQGR